ncbi:hypothetical protein [Bacterioplanoides sp.]|uniref:hypothetical protein n=1 Tax=Bacterioplanoides sp. TaxID=2066072 RepID=UPI003AFFFD58
MSALLRCLTLVGLFITSNVLAHDLTPCQQKSKAVLEIINKGTPSAAWNQELITLAKGSAINSDCNHWQYNILYGLSGSQFPTGDYRRWLFAQLDVVEAQELDTLIPKTLDYVFADQQQGQAIASSEWPKILQAVARMPAQDVAALPAALSQHTEQQPAKNEKDSHGKQAAETLTRQLDELAGLAGSERLGTPPLNKADWLGMMLKAIAVRQPELMVDYYNKQGAQLDKPLYLLKPVTRYYRYVVKNNQNELLPAADQALNQLLEQLSLKRESLNSNSKTTLKLLVSDLEKAAAKRPDLQQKLDVLRKGYPVLSE